MAFSFPQFPGTHGRVRRPSERDFKMVRSCMPRSVAGCYFLFFSRLLIISVA